MSISVLILTESVAKAVEWQTNLAVEMLNILVLDQNTNKVLADLPCGVWKGRSLALTLRLLLIS
jgi:hypothetical protein